MASHDHESRELAQFGYRQELDRSLGSFSSFAAGFSYISILTGMFQLFYFGFGAGGPAFFWTWPLVFVGQFLVALCFAELAAQYPIAGSVYNWSKQVAGKFVSWLAGWMMLTASIVTVGAVALAWQIILPQISPKFQIIGDGTGSTDFAKNAVLLGAILIILTTIINCIGVGLMAKINNIGVAAELVGATLLVILLAVHITRGPGIVLETYGVGNGHDWGYFGAFLIAALMSAYVMYGFDTAGSLAEETKEPRRFAPKALLRALAAEIPPGERIITVETELELGLDRYPDLHPDVVALEARTENVEGVGEVSASDLVRMSLRMNLDRVIVGEVRGDEIIPMLNAMSQGNDGSMCTVHADSSGTVFDKLALYAMQAPERLPVEATHQLAAAAIDLVVFIAKTAQGRRVASVRQVVGAEDRTMITNELFAPDADGRAVPAVPLPHNLAQTLAAHGYDASRHPASDGWPS